MDGLNINLTYFIISAYKSWREGDRFFNQFNLFRYIQNKNLAELIQFCMILFNELKNYNERAFICIHKGTPYYWMGTASYLMKDFTSATYFFDSAVSEDINNKNDIELQDSPSILFALLDDSKSGQAARSLVKDAIRSLNKYINLYNDPRFGENPITIEFIRESLLERTIYDNDYSKRSLSTSFISFFLEWSYRQSLINLRTLAGSEESFYLHLFKGCLLFESLLKENPTNKPSKKDDTLYKVLKHLKIDLDFNKPEINIGNTTLEKIQKQLISLPNDLDDYIEITGRLRNTLGHNLVWNVNINAESYHKFFTCIALSCLHVINKLYQK